MLSTLDNFGIDKSAEIDELYTSGYIREDLSRSTFKEMPKKSDANKRDFNRTTISINLINRL